MVERWQIAARELAALCVAQLTKLPASAGASTVAAKDVWCVIQRVAPSPAGTPSRTRCAQPPRTSTFSTPASLEPRHNGNNGRAPPNVGRTGTAGQRGRGDVLWHGDVRGHTKSPPCRPLGFSAKPWAAHAGEALLLCCWCCEGPDEWRAGRRQASYGRASPSLISLASSWCASSTRTCQSRCDATSSQTRVLLETQEEVFTEMRHAPPVRFRHVELAQPSC